MDERRKVMKSILSMLSFAVIVLLLMTAGDSLSTSPSPRAYHQMVYDPDSGYVILYGGQTGEWNPPENFNHETWLFDPEKNVWTEVTPEVSPGGSVGGSMTYDSNAKRIILSVISDDLTELQTWAYETESNTWTRLANGPLNMLGQRIVYDAESDRTIMFGGIEMTKYKFIDETWAYDYNTDTWRNMHPSGKPHGRNYHGMVYDPIADRIIVWGGDIQGPIKQDLIWMYDYNTNTWKKSKYENGPANRDYLDLVYNVDAECFITYGGTPYGNDETWVYTLDTNTWQQTQPANNPGLLSRYTMVYAQNIDRAILFGGQDGPERYNFTAETWSYDLNTDTWTNLSP
jgi:hypothetical protein